MLKSVEVTRYPDALHAGYLTQLRFSSTRKPPFPLRPRCALLWHHPQRHGGEAGESAAEAARVEDGHLPRHQSWGGCHGVPGMEFEFMGKMGIMAELENHGTYLGKKYEKMEIRMGRAVQWIDKDNGSREIRALMPERQGRHANVPRKPILGLVL